MTLTKSMAHCCCAKTCASKCSAPYEDLIVVGVEEVKSESCQLRL